jgi:hypothetical protein
MPDATLATAADMRAIAGQLAAAGMDARVESAGGYLYVVARGNGGGTRFEAIVDDDGHVELRWLHQPAGSHAQLTAVITRAMAVITGGAEPAGGARPLAERGAGQ